MISIAQVTGGADVFDLNGLWRSDDFTEQNDEEEAPTLDNYSVSTPGSDPQNRVGNKCKIENGPSVYHKHERAQ